jgi:hypothetical protein
MATEKFSNDPVTILNGAISSSSLSVIVVDASTFPHSPQFRIKIDAEVLLVTAVSGNTFTVTRGAEGTIAVSHLDGAAVTHILTAGALEQLKLDIVTPISSSTPSTLVVGGSGSAGSSTNVSASDHNHPMPAFGTTTGTFAQGNDSRFISIDQTDIPTTVVPGGSGGTGISGKASDANHSHPMAGFGSTGGTFCQGNDSRLSDDRTASGLRAFLGGLVDVSSASAPSAGQVLMATDSSHATWQTITTTPPMIFVAGVSTPASATPTRMGSRQATASATMTLVVQLEATAGTAHAQIYDNTALAIVTSVTTTNTTTTRLTQSGLSIVSGHVYELQVWLVGGNPSIDKAIISYGELS